MNKSLSPKILWSFIGGIFLIALIGLFYLISISSLTKSTETLGHLYNKINRVQQLQFLVKQAETGPRGFLISEDEDFLKNYPNSKNAILKELEVFQTDFYKDENESLTFSNLKKLIYKKIELNDKIISLVKANKKDEALQLVAFGEDKKIIEEIDRIANNIIESEKKILAESNNSFYRQSDRGFILIFSGKVVTMILFFIAILKLKAELIKKQDLEQELHKKNQALGETNNELHLKNNELETANQTILTFTKSSLKNQENHFRMIINNIPFPLLIVDIDSNLKFINDAGTKQFGIVLSENFNASSASTEGILSDLTQTIHLVISDGKIIESEIVVNLENINNTYLLRYVPLMEDQKITQILITSYNITERKNYEKRILSLNEDLDKKVKERTQQLEDINLKLKEKSEEIFDLYNNAPLGYYSVNNNGEIIKINKTSLHLLGYFEQEILGKNIRNILISKENTEFFNLSFERMKSGEKVENMEGEFIKKDGSVLPVLINVTPIMDPNGNFVMSRSAFTDNTELRKTKSEVEKYVEALQMANKELESFSYSISHDLRAPLRSINGFGSILKNDYYNLLDEEGKRYLDIILQNSAQMGQLIDDLLKFAKLGRMGMTKTSFSMGGLIEEVLSTNHVFHKNPREYTEVSEMPAILGDRNLIKQVWINLISNALKFSSKKEMPNVKIYYEEDPYNYTFYIKDNGAGFDKRYESKLFGVFQRLHSSEEFEGTGAGLAIVQRIIHSHGGKIWAESELNEGATFYFTLPKE